MYEKNLNIYTGYVFGLISACCISHTPVQQCIGNNVWEFEVIYAEDLLVDSLSDRRFLFNCRQAHRAAFGKSDLFFTCALKPLTSTIAIQESEIEDCKVSQQITFPLTMQYCNIPILQYCNVAFDITCKKDEIVFLISCVEGVCASKVFKISTK